MRTWQNATKHSSWKSLHAQPKATWQNVTLKNAIWKIKEHGSWKSHQRTQQNDLAEWDATEHNGTWQNAIWKTATWKNATPPPVTHMTPPPSDHATQPHGNSAHAMPPPDLLSTAGSDNTSAEGHKN
ncbi:hypothetical protein MMC29_001152, partial [Sticta canariensis]|nr:hypothetical protein [Sticta canariensis]